MWSNDDECTNNYQADRVQYSKNMQIILVADPNHYVIFEHLGGDSEKVNGQTISSTMVKHYM